MNNLDVVEVDEKMELGMCFFVGFEEVFFLVDIFEFEVMFCGRNVDEFGFVFEYDVFNVFGILEELVVIIVVDDLFMVVFVMDIDIVGNFVVLVFVVLI